MAGRIRKYALLARSKMVREWACGKQVAGVPEGFRPDNTLHLVFGGDVSFDRQIRSLPYIGAFRVREKPIPFPFLTRVKKKVVHACAKLLFEERLYKPLIGVPFQEILLASPENELRRGHFSSVYHRSQQLRLEDDAVTRDGSYPFAKLSGFLRSKDLVVVNLETPLCYYARAQGFFISHPDYARGMRESGITLANLANNHSFDAGEPGFVETMRHLDSNGIGYFGGGANLAEARKGRLVEIKGMTHLFLGYSQYCIHRYSSMAAEYPGILPMDFELIRSDIRAGRSKADFVHVSVHWGFEDQPMVHPRQVEIAHGLIDAGADVIIGHHPHIPHAVEIYKGKPIFYSLGNFVFGQSEASWGDNFLAEIVIVEKTIREVLIHPVAGTNPQVFQPGFLPTARANDFLEDMRLKSAFFGTRINIGREGVGTIALQ